MGIRDIGAILADAKNVAKEYYLATGRPLGITGELGEYEAHRLLGVTLSAVRTDGFDAKEGEKRLQIKTRCVADASKGGMIGSIKLDKPWDAVLLVLLDQEMEPMAIYEAERKVIEEELTKPGSKARNERGALSIAKFRQIGRTRWRKIGGV